MVAFEKAPPEAMNILPVPIRELGLKLEGTHLASQIEQLYRELDEHGLHHFRPPCYLSDEWGCPSEEPVIGIPFYLADPRTADIENALNDVENDREIMMFLRHEAGHALNYAYELYKTPEWTEVFGPFRRPYRDDYPFVPFSRQFVRHIAGWYAQKHPDEDFAETFAVWLDPASKWRKKYAGWGAMKKLLYVDRIMKELGDVKPLRAVGEIDYTVDEMQQTVEEFYRETTVDESAAIAGLALDTDLTDIFVLPQDCTARREYRPAAELLAEHRRDIVDRVNYWTGVRRTLVRTLVESIERQLGELALLADIARSRSHMIEITVYVTTLAMTFLTGGKSLRHRTPSATE
jgi:hypothetical protein